MAVYKQIKALSTCIIALLVVMLLTTVNFRSAKACSIVSFEPSWFYESINIQATPPKIKVETVIPDNYSWPQLIFTSPAETEIFVFKRGMQHFQDTTFAELQTIIEQQNSSINSQSWYGLELSKTPLTVPLDWIITNEDKQNLNLFGFFDRENQSFSFGNRSSPYQLDIWLFNSTTVWKVSLTITFGKTLNDELVPYFGERTTSTTYDHIFDADLIVSGLVTGVAPQHTSGFGETSYVSENGYIVGVAEVAVDHWYLGSSIETIFLGEFGTTTCDPVLYKNERKIFFLTQSDVNDRVYVPREILDYPAKLDREQFDRDLREFIGRNPDQTASESPSVTPTQTVTKTLAPIAIASTQVPIPIVQPTATLENSSQSDVLLSMFHGLMGMVVIAVVLVRLLKR